MSNRIKTPYGTMYLNQERGGLWHLTGTVPTPSGKPYRFNKSLKTANQKEATKGLKALYDEVANEAQKRVSEPEQEPVIQADPTIQEELSLFLHTFYEVRSKSGEIDESTWEDADKCLGKFFDACEATKISQLNPSLVTATWNKIGVIAPKYKAKVVYACRKFLRWEMDKKNLTEDPFRDVTVPPRKSWGKGKDDDDPWEDQHYTEFMVACKEMKCPHVRPLDWEIFTLLRGLGISQADIYTMDERDFRTDSHGLILDKQREKSGIFYNQPITKAGQPISQLCEQILLERFKVVKKGERLWKQGNTDQERWVNDMTNRRRRIQLWLNHPVCTTKGLRSMFATEQILAGYPEFVVLQWMGHSEDSTILRRHYLRLQSTRQWTLGGNKPLSQSQ